MPDPTQAPAVSATGVPVPVLPPLTAQAERLVALGVHELAGLSAAEVRDETARLAGVAGDLTSLLVLPAQLAPPSVLAPLMTLPARGGERAGFVVEDMSDVDGFTPLEGLEVPGSPLYALADPDRGDDLANWSPDEVLPELARRGRTPLLLVEGIHWALQTPGVLAPGACFMTIGSRLRTTGGRLDRRAPAVWISGGTGRDGRSRRGAPKVGWCWAGNRHTWLGFASASGRRG